MGDTRTLQVVITGDNAGAVSAMKGVSSAVKGADGDTSSSGSRWRTFGGVVAAATGIAATAVVGLGVATAKMGINVASQMETSEMAFTTMLGSTEKAKAFMGDLSAFAAKTPFELPGITQASSRLVAVGVETSKVIPLMTALGDATAGMGTGAEGIDRAVTALTQMRQKGKVSAEDMQQMAEAGIPAWDALAAHLGKTVAQTQEMVTKGKVKVESVFAAIETKAGGAFGKLDGMMVAQSSTLGGLWSTWQDTLGQASASIVQPMIPLLKEGLVGAINLVSAYAPIAASYMGKLAEKITFAVNQFKDGGGIERWKNGFEGLVQLVSSGTFSESLTKAFGWDKDSESVNKILAVRDAVIGLFASLKGGSEGAAGKGLDGFQQSLAQMGGPLGVIMEKLPSLSSIMDGLNNSWIVGAALLGFFAEHADILAAALPYLVAGYLAIQAAQAAKNVADTAALPIQAGQVASNFALAAALRGSGNAALMSALQQAIANGEITGSETIRRTSMLSTVATTLTGWASMAAAAVASAARQVGAWVLMGTQAMLQAARMAAAWFIALGPIGWVIAGVAALAALIIANWDTVSAATQKVWTWVKETITRAWQGVVDLFFKYHPVGIIITHWESIKAASAVAWQWIKQKVTDLWNGLVGLFMKYHPVGIIISHWDQIKAFTAAAWAAIKVVVSNAWNSLVEAVKSGVAKAVQTVKDMPAGLVYSLQGLAGMLLKAGQDAMQGFLNGISNIAGKVTQKARDIANSVTSTIKDALKIHSPSRVMVEIGEYVGDGLVKGLTDSSSKVEAATNKLADVVEKGFKQRAAELTDIQKAENEKLIRTLQAQQDRLNGHNSKAAKAQKAYLDGRIQAARDAGKLIADINTQAAIDSTNAVLASVQSMETALAEIAASREKNAERIKEATKNLEDAIKLRDDFSNKIYEQAYQLGNLTGVKGQVNADGKEIAVTFSDIIAQMGAAATSIDEYGRKLQQLKDAGLSNSMYKELAEAGAAKGGAYVDAIIAAGPGAVEKLNKLADRLDVAAQTLGNTTARSLYQAGVDSAQGLLNGLESKEAELLRTAERIANRIAERIRAALDIHSPSRVMAAVGSNVGAGLVVGMTDSIPAIDGAARAMVEMGLSPVMDLDPTGANRSGGGVAPVGPAPVYNIEQNFYGFSTEEARRLAREGTEEALGGVKQKIRSK